VRKRVSIVWAGFRLRVCTRYNHMWYWYKKEPNLSSYIKRIYSKIDTCAYIYMVAHFPGLVQKLQYNTWKGELMTESCLLITNFDISVFILWGPSYSFCSFLCSVLVTIFCVFTFCFFLLPLLLSGFFRMAASDYPCDIINIFFCDSISNILFLR